MVRGHWITTVNGERPGESRFAVPCSPRRSPFAAPFPIYFVQCSLFKVRYSMFAAPFAIHHAVRHLPRPSPRRSPFAPPFPIHFPQFSLFKLRYSMFAALLAIRRAIRRAIRCRFSMSPDAFHTFSQIFAIQASLFNGWRAVRHSQFTIRQSPSHSPFAAPFAVAFQCPLTLSINVFIICASSCEKLTKSKIGLSWNQFKYCSKSLP